MTTLAVPAQSHRPVALVLAVHEARRLTLHPVMLVGWALMALWFGLTGAIDVNPVTAFDLVSVGATFYPGLFCVLAAHMVTTRDQRAGTADLIDAAPASREQRVLALLLAAFAPAIIALAVNLVTRQAMIWQEAYVETPGLAHVTQAPVTVLGGSLLGIMLGMWLPHRTTPVVAMVALVAGSMAFDSANGRMALFSPMVSWVDWGPYDGTAWYALETGHPGAHVLYLLGLCGLAAVAAWLRATEHRWVAVALGIASFALALWGGLTQLP